MVEWILTEDWMWKGLNKVFFLSDKFHPFYQQGAGLTL